MSQSRVIFITGGTRGIGYEFANQYLALGDKVAIFARDQQSLERIKTHFSTKYPDRIIVFSGNVSNYDDVRNAVEQTMQTWGHIDIAIANAGQALIGPIDELQPHNIHQQFSVNFDGALNTAFATKPYLKTANGTLVIISSIAAYIATPMSPAYSASKAAVKFYFDAERESYHRNGISIVQLLPGIIESDIQHVRPDNTYDPNYNNPSVSAGTKLIKPASAQAAVSDMITAIQEKQPEQIITRFGKLAVFGMKHLPSLMNKIGVRDYEKYIKERDRSKEQPLNPQKPDLKSPFHLQNKIALMVVSNANHVEMARQLLSRGLKVSLLITNEELVKEFGDNQENSLISLVDITKAEDIHKAVNDTLQKWHRLDLVIFNPVKLNPEAKDLSEFSTQQMHVNFGGAINLNYAVFDELKKSQGAFILIGDQNSFFAPSQSSAYSASIMAIRTFFKAARASYEDIGISIIQITPDDKTPIHDDIGQMIAAIQNREQEIFIGLDKKTANLLTCHAGLFSVSAANELHKESLQTEKSTAVNSASSHHK